MPGFQIQLTTTADTSGVTKTRDALDDLEKKTRKSGEEARESEHHIEGLHEVIRKISEISPEAGEALRSAFAVNPITAAAFALFAIVEVLKKVKEQANETQLSIIAMGVASEKAAEDAAKAHDDFIQKLHSAKDALGEISSAYDHQKAVLDAQVESRKTIIDLMEKEEIAAAKGDKSKEEEIRTRYDSARLDYEVATEQKKIELHQKYLDSLKSRQPELDRAAAESETGIEKLKAQPPVPGFKEDEEKEAKLKKEVDDRQAELRRFQTGTRTPTEFLLGKSEAEIRGDLLAAEKLYNVYMANKKAMADYNTELDRQTNLLHQNESARDANKETVKKESAALDTERDVAKVHQAGAARQKSFDILDRAGGLANASDIIGKGVEDISAYQHGQRISAAQATELAAFRQLFAMLGGKDQVIVATVKEALTHGASVTQEIARLKEQFARLSAQMRSGAVLNHQ